MKEPEFRVGQRVSVDNERATVKYVGPVEGTKGVWLGVDWDKECRGKHDGSHEGKKYFETRGATSGSFVRTAKATAGCSLLQAAEQRYADSATPLDYSSSIGSKQIELVGMEYMQQKQKHLRNLRHCVLDFTNVSDCGEPSGLQTELCRCELLDLSATFVHSWTQIVHMIEALSNCKTLNLSVNRLSPLTDDEFTSLGECSAKTSHLENLLLNDIDYDWEQVLPVVLRLFPSVRMLGVCHNRVARITGLTADCLQNLTEIDLKKNLITDWADILPLAALKSLESINLSQNAITSISFPEDKSPADPFPSLHELVLRGCQIDQWPSVTCLSVLPRLSQLVLHGNPVLDTFAPETSRQIVIARLAGLTKLDRQQVTLQERRGAEIDYLKRFGKEWLEAKDDETKMAAHLAEHPRYNQMIEIYGAPDKSEIEGIQRTGLIKDKLVNVKITCDTLDKPLERSLPTAMTVNKLRALCARMCKLRSKSINMFYVPILRVGFDEIVEEDIFLQQKPDQRIPLDNDLRQLQYFCMEDGDEINVQLA